MAATSTRPDRLESITLSTIHDLLVHGLLLPPQPARRRRCCAHGSARTSNPNKRRRPSRGCSLTAGFVQVELPEGNFVVQRPYDVAENQRYSYDFATGVRTFWVLAGDKPFNSGTTTNPRTEIRIRGHDYSSGVWQFEGYCYVPSGTSGASVMQIHNENVVGAAHATTMMLHVYNGTLRYYSGEAVEDCIYDRWFRLNVVHDVGASTVAVHVDGVERLAVAVPPSASHYFKFGVYVQHHDVSLFMESRWRNVTVYNKPC